MTFVNTYTQREVEAKRLVGDPDQIQDIFNWITSKGVEWLLGDASKPETLVNSKGDIHTPGIYIEPKYGSLVIRNPTKSVYRADHGMWIVYEPVESLEGKTTPVFVPINHVAFIKVYQPSGN